MSPAVQYQKIMSLEAIFFVSGAPKIFLTVIVLVTVVVSVIVNINWNTNDMLLIPLWVMAISQVVIYRI